MGNSYIKTLKTEYIRRELSEGIFWNWDIMCLGEFEWMIMTGFLLNYVSYVRSLINTCVFYWMSCARDTKSDVLK